MAKELLKLFSNILLMLSFLTPADYDISHELSTISATFFMYYMFESMID